MDVVFEDLERRDAKWGFYRTQALLENDWDCDLILGSSDPSNVRQSASDYFLPEAHPVVDAVEAILVAVVLRDSSRVPVAAWRSFDDEREIILPGPNRADIPRLLEALRESKSGGGRVVRCQGVKTVLPYWNISRT